MHQSSAFSALMPVKKLLNIATLWLLPAYAFAAEATADENAVWWNLIIAIIVLAATLASAALPLAALRQWPKSWRLAAVFPLAILALWVLAIVLGRAADANSHRLWPFEVFSWAMLNMIYMVAVMTYKRQIDKATDNSETSTQSADSASDQAS